MGGKGLRSAHLLAAETAYLPPRISSTTGTLDKRGGESLLPAAFWPSPCFYLLPTPLVPEPVLVLDPHPGEWSQPHFLDLNHPQAPGPPEFTPLPAPRWPLLLDFQDSDPLTTPTTHLCPIYNPTLSPEFPGSRKWWLHLNMKQTICPGVIRDMTLLGLLKSQRLQCLLMLPQLPTASACLGL